MCNHRNISIRGGPKYVILTRSERPSYCQSANQHMEKGSHRCTFTIPYIYIPRSHTLHMALNPNTVLHHCAHTHYIHTYTYIAVAISWNVYIMPCSPQGEYGMMLSPAEPLGTLGMDLY